MRRIGVAFVFWMLVGTASARADLIYQYVTDQTTYTASSAGSVVSVNVFLQETVTGSSSSIIAQDGGLYGAAFLVTRSGTVPTNPALITLPNPITPNNAATPNGFGAAGTYDFNPSTTTQAGLQETVNLNPNGFVGPAVAGTPGVFKLFLGSINITAGEEGSSTQFTLSKFTPGAGLTITNNNFFDLDAPGSGLGQTWLGASSSNFTVETSVAAVPEPSSMALMAFPAGLFAFCWWRRRRVCVVA